MSVSKGTFYEERHNKKNINSQKKDRLSDAIFLFTIFHDKNVFQTCVFFYLKKMFCYIIRLSFALYFYISYTLRDIL